MRKGSIIGAVVLAVLLAGGYFWFRAGHPPTYVTTPVVRGPLVQQVLASGNVAAPTTIDLQFQVSGRLTMLGVQVGDHVRAGGALARLDTSVLDAQLQQAQAQVAAAQAGLATLQQGTRPEQVAVAQSQVASDETALAQANQSVINAIQSAYTAADDAVHNKLDQFITNPRSSTPSLAFTTTNQQVANVVLSERTTMESTLGLWQSNMVNLAASGGDAGVQREALSNLAVVAQVLSDSNSTLNSAIPNSQVSQSTISSWITNVATARAAVNTAITTLNSAIILAQTTAAALDRDQKTLALQEAGSTNSSLAAGQASVAQAQAQVAAIEAQLSQMALTTPVRGTVTQVTGDVGETVMPSTVVITILPDSTLQTNVNVSEDAIANVQVGDPVSISLDAFSNTTWQGTVTKIDPAQTIIGGAVYYKATVVFAKSDTRVKPGMTANVLVQTGAASSTLLIPASALQSDATGSFVQVYTNDDTVVKTPVTTGLRSQSGQIEILSGLSAGDLIVTGTK